MPKKTFKQLDVSDYQTPTVSNLGLVDSILREGTREHAEIPFDHLLPNPRQPRTYFNEESIGELAADIQENGLIEEIVVRVSPTKEGFYEIICGERRARACRDMLKWTAIPAQIRACTDAEMLRIAIAENDQHQQLTPYERARAYD